MLLENEKIGVFEISIEHMKISPYVNARMILMMMANYVQMLNMDTSDKDRERIASEIKSILNLYIGIYHSNKMVPIVSLGYICKFMLANDENISSAARDLLVIPFIKRSRQENVLRLIE